jgi:hypothetical protein
MRRPAFAVLHDQALKRSVGEVEQLFREDFGKELHELFATFDKVPLVCYERLPPAHARAACFLPCLGHIYAAV